MGDLFKCLQHYSELPYNFTQIDYRQKATLEAYWESIYGSPRTSTGSTNNEYYDKIERSIPSWNRPNVHIVTQLWSNTSGGWEGRGGCAMTNSYTIIIENPYIGLACIYYGNKLAYMVKIDSEYQKHAQSNYYKLPGLSSVKNSGLDVIYVSSKY